MVALPASLSQTVITDILLLSDIALPRHSAEVDLCHKRPGFEPNGEHLDGPGDDLLVHANWTITDPSVAHSCLMRFSTCNNCRLHVEAVTSFHYRRCPSSEANKVYDGWCVPG